MDPITFEIIRHRLSRVIQESVITLKHVSGSEIVNEGHDLIVSLHRSDGRLLLAGVGYTSRTPSAAEACKHICRRFAGKINEGDIFLLNDPYVAAFHTSDIHLISPIHLGGRIIAWSVCFVHVNDIGALGPGGFSPESIDIYTEGFSTPGIKLVDRGEVREDLLDTIRNMVRTPAMVTLDIKSMIACHNVARARYLDLVGKYGIATVDEACEALLDMSGRLLRERLLELPQGRWQSRQYMEIKGEIYRVALSMTNRDGKLTFDFTGSSPQSPFPINASHWATRGAVFSPLYAVLCHDITWNEGLAAAVTLTTPEGLIVNCQRPAPLSVATVGTAALVSMVVLNALSKMLAASDRFVKDCTAGWNAGVAAIFLYGLNQHGHQAISFLTDIFAGSGGARSWADGVDAGGDIPNPIARFANVETIEARLPIRYLFRKRVCDSGGPGQYRGGAGVECAIVPHEPPSGHINFIVACKGISYPGTEGIAGGHVGSTCYHAWVHANEARDRVNRPAPFARNADELIGRHEPVTWGVYKLAGDDALYVRLSGGGGFGDPLDREPETVLADVRKGLVSDAYARDVYGVVIEGREFDRDGTQRQRSAIRAARMGRAAE